MFFDLLDKGWPGELDPRAADAYTVLLDGTDPVAVTAGLRMLLHRGQRFRPSAAEILGACRQAANAGRPTWDEALQSILWCLKARPGRVAAPEGGWRSEGQMVWARRDAAEQAIAERLRQAHPMVADFVARHGVDRVRGVEDEIFGGARRHELGQAWAEYVETFDGRQVAELAAGRGARGLHQLDPLASLGLSSCASQIDAPAAAVKEGSA